jgi:hypothetical protein
MKIIFNCGGEQMAETQPIYQTRPPTTGLPMTQRTRTYTSILRERFSRMYQELQLTGDVNGEITVNLDCLFLDILVAVGMMDYNAQPADVHFVLDLRGLI